MKLIDIWMITEDFDIKRQRAVKIDGGYLVPIDAKQHRNRNKSGTRLIIDFKKTWDVYETIKEAVDAAKDILAHKFTDEQERRLSEYKKRMKSLVYIGNNIEQEKELQNMGEQLRSI